MHTWLLLSNSNDLPRNCTSHDPKNSQKKCIQFSTRIEIGASRVESASDLSLMSLPHQFSWQYFPPFADADRRRRVGVRRRRRRQFRHNGGNSRAKWDRGNGEVGRDRRLISGALPVDPSSLSEKEESCPKIVPKNVETKMRTGDERGMGARNTVGKGARARSARWRRRRGGGGK